MANVEANATKLAQLINPEVMSDMVSAKVEKKIIIMPYAKLDTTLQGQAGSTITVPKYGYIGDAVDVAEGNEIPVRQMSTSSVTHTVKKAAIGGVLTDEAVLSGYGNPVGELNNQMAKSIASKCDNDAMAELLTATTGYSASGIISYNNVVNAIDLFEEEENGEKAMLIHPKQVTQLRLDSNFISKDKYGNQVMIDGEIGMIGNARIVPSKKCPLIKYTVSAAGTTNAKEVVADTATPSGTQIKAGDVKNVTWDATNKKVVEPAVGDYVLAVANNYYINPIIKLETETETEDESPALTVYLKRDTNVETERKPRNRSTEVTGDKMFVVALTNDTKVVLGKMYQVASI